MLALIDVPHLGPASRTLAALVDIADQDRQTTFKSLARIAVIAGLSVATVARHLVTLGAEGYVAKLGRRGRRTVTYRLVAKVENLLADPYLPLSKAQRALPWSQAATLAYLTRWTGKDGLISTSPRVISRAINMSIRSVKNAMAALQSAGLISRGPAPTFWVVGCKNDVRRGANLTVAVNRKLLEPNSEKPPLPQEHVTEPSPPPKRVVFVKTPSAPSPMPPPRAKPKLHTLGHIDRSDLVDPAAAIKIVETRKGPLSPHRRVLVAAEAVHALRVGANPMAMFATNIQAGRWYATAADEDLAMARLRRAPPIAEPVSAGLANLLRPPD